jgi:hypothetical protein
MKIHFFLNELTNYLFISFISNKLAMKHEKVLLICCGRNHTVLATGKLIIIIKLLKEY